MTKKSFLIFLLLFALSLTSCDWIRYHLGMPTSVELQARQEQTRQDSLLYAEYLRQEREQYDLMEDALFDAALSVEDEVTPSSGQYGLYGENRQDNSNTNMNRFHVIVGSFREPANAAKMVKQLADHGYKPHELQFRNGYRVVSAGSYAYHDDAEAAKRSIQTKDPALCPYDVYIYDMNDRRHVEDGVRR